MDSLIVPTQLSGGLVKAPLKQPGIYGTDDTLPMRGRQYGTFNGAGSLLKDKTKLLAPPMNVGAYNTSTDDPRTGYVTTADPSREEVQSYGGVARMYKVEDPRYERVASEEGAHNALALRLDTPIVEGGSTLTTAYRYGVTTGIIPGIARFDEIMNKAGPPAGPEYEIQDRLFWQDQAPPQTFDLEDRNRVISTTTERVKLPKSGYKEYTNCLYPPSGKNNLVYPTRDTDSRVYPDALVPVHAVVGDEWQYSANDGYPDVYDPTVKGGIDPIKVSTGAEWVGDFPANGISTATDPFITTMVRSLGTPLFGIEDQEDLIALRDRMKASIQKQDDEYWNFFRPLLGWWASRPWHGLSTDMTEKDGQKFVTFHRAVDSGAVFKGNFANEINPYNQSTRSCIGWTLDNSRTDEPTGVRSYYPARDDMPDMDGTLHAAKEPKRGVVISTASKGGIDYSDYYNYPIMSGQPVPPIVDVVPITEQAMDGNRLLQ